jgi:hypothetical protein
MALTMDVHQINVSVYLGRKRCRVRSTDIDREPVPGFTRILLGLSVEGVASNASGVQTANPCNKNLPNWATTFCHWVEPALVAQVKFTEWTLDDQLR